jgi:hypothetical protein
VPLPVIVQRALTETVTDVGQLTRAERAALRGYVRRGCLARGQGGPYPSLKTVYAVPGYDFAGERRRTLQRMLGGRAALAEAVTLVDE